MFNPWMASHYPVVPVPMPPPSQFPPQFPDLGEPSVWFEDLVTAVSKKIKDDERNAAADDIEKKKATPADLSAKDEKALVDALRKQKEGKLTMEQAFRELSQKYGHTDLEWKTWFFASYERLISEVDPTPNVGRASEDGSGSTTSVSPVVSHTGSASINWSSRSSTITAANTTLPDSREESDSEREELSGLDEISTSHEYDGSPPPGRHAPQLRAETTVDTNTPLTLADKPMRGARNRVPVTEEDLRMMALYQFEQGDDCEVRRYGYSRWREFAQRPENRKRTLAAWTCVPRVPSHAAAIDRYVKEYQLQAEVAEYKPVPSVFL